MTDLSEKLKKLAHEWQQLDNLRDPTAEQIARYEKLPEKMADALLVAAFAIDSYEEYAEKTKSQVSMIAEQLSRYLAPEKK